MRASRRPAAVASAVLFAALARSATGAAQTAGEDLFELQLRSETYAELFRRALLPGPNGALVESETAAPFHQYIALDAYNLDTGLGQDSVDLELSAWARAWLGASDLERPFDGDVQTANVRYHAGPAWVTVGRQQAVGGAARYARFDGVMVGARAPFGLFAEGYAGLTVLPRWDARPGYHHLGSAEGALLRDEEPRPERSGYWLAGGQVGYRGPGLSGAASFHEQREAGGLARRNLGLDARAELFDRASLGSALSFELDAERLADLRMWLDARPHERLDVSLEFLRAEPALLLSRQSVLSVFSTEGYDEAGGVLLLRVLRELSLENSGYVEFYDSSRPGARGETALRVVVGKQHRTMVRVAYARVLAPDNGYHSLRSSLSRRLLPRLSGTIEAYGYVYDQLVQGFRTSSVYAGTLSYRALEVLEFSWGASVAQSPYAALDAETILRASYVFDAQPRRPAW